MKRFIKNVICVTLSSSISITSMIPVLAFSNQNNSMIINNTNSSNKDFKVILDNETQRISEEIIENLKYIYTFQKKDKLLKTEIYDLNNKKINESIIDISEFIGIGNDNNIKESKGYSPHYQNTFSNYEYERKGFSDEYELRNKNYYKMKSLENDRDAIEKYVEAVDNLNNAEIAIIITGGTTLFYTIKALLDKGMSAGQIATSTGVLIGDITAYNLSVSKCKSVWNLYID